MRAVAPHYFVASRLTALLHGARDILRGNDTLLMRAYIVTWVVPHHIDTDLVRPVLRRDLYVAHARKLAAACRMKTYTCRAQIDALKMLLESVFDAHLMGGPMPDMLVNKTQPRLIDTERLYQNDLRLLRDTRHARQLFTCAYNGGWQVLWIGSNDYVVELRGPQFSELCMQVRLPDTTVMQQADMLRIDMRHTYVEAMWVTRLRVQPQVCVHLIPDLTNIVMQYFCA